VLEDLAAQDSYACGSMAGIYEMDSTPKLDPKRKNTLEAVVESHRVRADSGQRLAEVLLRPALRLSNGLARLTFLDEPDREELVFSRASMRARCALQRAHPRAEIVLVNNPAGACPPATGWQQKRVFSIPPRGRESQTCHWRAAPCGSGIGATPTLPTHHSRWPGTTKFDMRHPGSSSRPRSRKVLLYGSGEDVIEFRLTK